MPSDKRLLDWLEKRWEQDDDCPISQISGEFFPVCESGSWPPNMTLRQAIAAAMRVEEQHNAS